jgi:hypothetical protein
MGFSYESTTGTDLCQISFACPRRLAENRNKASYQSSIFFSELVFDLVHLKLLLSHQYLVHLKLLLSHQYLVHLKLLLSHQYLVHLKLLLSHQYQVSGTGAAPASLLCNAYLQFVRTYFLAKCCRIA